MAWTAFVCCGVDPGNWKSIRGVKVDSILAMFLVGIVSSYISGTILFWLLHSSNLLPLGQETLHDYFWGAVTCLIWPVAVFWYLNSRRRM